MFDLLLISLSVVSYWLRNVISTGKTDLSRKFYRDLLAGTVDRLTAI